MLAEAPTLAHHANEALAMRAAVQIAAGQTLRNSTMRSLVAPVGVHVQIAGNAWHGLAIGTVDLHDATFRHSHEAPGSLQIHIAMHSLALRKVCLLSLHLSGWPFFAF